MNKFYRGAPLIMVLGFLALFFSLEACTPEPAKENSGTPEIRKQLLGFDSLRTRLSLEYMEDHYGLIQEKPVIDPEMIVVHWTVIPTFEETFEFFDPPVLNASRGDISGAGALNVSAHYLIKRNGDIYQLMPDTVMARHVIGLNHKAIGIENIGSSDRPLTMEQLRANEMLIRHLTGTYDINFLIGHYEYIFFEHHRLWGELDDGYRTEKEDPGIGFMVKLRHRLKDLQLKGIPKGTVEGYLQ